MPQTTLIQNCTLLSSGNNVPTTEGYVRITDNVISDFGTMDQMPSRQDSVIINGKHHLVMPGLINAHNHSAMSLFRGLADDLQLSTWLQDYIFPAEATYVTEKMVYWCTRLAAIEMIRSGTTCVADGYFYSGAAAQAFVDCGLRAVVAHGILDFPAPGVPDPARNIATVKDFLDTWKNKDPLITPAVFAHSPYTCSPTTLVRAKQLANEYNVPFFIHLAESTQELALIQDSQGNSPLQHLQALKILDTNTICIHAIWLNKKDMDILQKSGAHVITCPQSNCKLSSGIAKITEMLTMDINVGLGTDGCASNNSLDMFRELGFLAKLHKVHKLDPTVLSARKVLQCATTNNNLALGHPSKNEIEIGNRADLVLLKLDAPHLTPFYNQDLLVYSARGSDVATAIIDGKFIMKEREITSVNVEETLKAVGELAKGITI